MIEVKSPEAANRLVENTIFPKHNLRAFIPAFKVLRTGVIQDVPTQIDDETLRTCIESPRAKILDVQRLNRRTVVDGKVEYVPAKTIRIKFAGQLLPQFVYIFKVRHEVRPFIPRPRTCNACFRTGHVQTTCRGAPRCLYCGGGKHNESNDTCQLQEGTPKCINCQGEHWANSSECPVIKRQHAIVNIAAVQNISIADAKTIVNSGKSLPKDAPNPYNSSSFPGLPDKGNSAFIRPNRFGLLGVDEQEDDLPSYANVFKSRPVPRPQRPRSGFNKEDSLRHPQRQNSQHNFEEFHNNWSETNGRMPSISGNSVAFHGNTGTRSSSTGTGKSSGTAPDAAELILLISEIITHFQNGNWPCIFNSVIRLVKILSNMFGPPPSPPGGGGSTVYPDFSENYFSQQSPTYNDHYDYDQEFNARFRH
ncbi:hypothetical protein ALC60_00863 [Trachymyrmex zeteki]|uniref:Nucleic-acid-binding protein from mobile element jockey n=1 Tax=Mycetomoellerius zeteki TaxID=64791 RepID=A0A151XI60_9HYME|nr:hypothetical protein ALC60_00863 [Trachymyrmex zeteki]